MWMLPALQPWAISFMGNLNFAVFLADKILRKISFPENRHVIYLFNRNFM